MLLDPALRSIHFAARPRVVAKYLSQIFLPLAALTAVPGVVSALSGDFAITARYAGLVALLLLLWALGSRLRCTQEVQTNEALVVSALVFVIAGVLSAWPLSGHGVPFEDALFESISGVTTTGLSALASVEGRPASFLFARAWLQWVGGLGVVVLALALLIEPGSAAKRLGFSERETHDVLGGTRAHAQRVLVVYLALTLAGVALLVVLGAGPFDALVHALAAVSTGGFSSHDASLGGLPGAPARIGTTLLCVAGAISFSWYYGGFHRRLRVALGDPQLRTLFGVGLVVAAALVLFASFDGAGGRPWSERVPDALYLAVSAQTTAGFSPHAVSELDAGSKLVLIGSMLIGGEVGSTAGGIKILRFMILLRMLQLLLVRTSLARAAVVNFRIGRERIAPREVETTAALLLAYAAVILVSWLAFLAHGYAPLDSLFEVVSATGTVGLSAGIVGPGLEPLLKGVLCADMLLGRVETVALFVLFFPPTWIGRRRKAT